MAGAILLGVLAGLVVVVLCTIIAWWAVRHCQDDGAGSTNDGGGVSSATTGKQEQEALLNKNRDDAADAVPDQPGGSGPEPEASDCAGAVDLCAICKAPLADARWGRCRRLRPCGHVFHADCVGMWLKRKRICPVCRAAVAMSSRPEILDAMV